jgi:class 3 adenylate cyclase
LKKLNAILASYWLHIVITAITSFLVITLYLTSAGRFIEESFSRPMEFRARVYLGRAPRLSDKIKVYAFDDHTHSTVDDSDLPIKFWAKLLADMAAAGPRMIFIDKVFGTLKGKEHAAEFLDLAKKIEVPIVVGSFVSQSQINGRPMINMDHRDYNLRGLISRSAKNEKSINMSQLDWMPIQAAYPYGPHESIVGAFPHIGHIMYRGHGEVEPFIRVDQERALPHLALFSADSLYFKNGELYINDKSVSIRRDGKIAVNFLAHEDISARTMSLKNAILRSAHNESHKGVIEKGQLIVILPSMFSGSTDWVDTPFGQRPGSHVILSMLNSVLEGQWLKTSGYETSMIIFSAAMGMMIGSGLSTLFCWTFIFLLTVAIPALGLCSFIFSDMILPWPFLMGALFFSAIAGFAMRIVQDEIRNRELRVALGGVISEERLHQILKKPHQMMVEPVGRVVSIMFIDIVGFSITAERLTSEEIFRLLKTCLRELTETIHRFGGIIDKTLGDGLLVFFGYSFDGRSEPSQHADEALRCAIELQQISYRNMLHAASINEPLFPLRIGINTAFVHIGDMGDTRRVDITMIGNGVNYASRLETACEPFRIMIGSSTKELVGFLPPKTPALHRRLIKIKHHSELLDAFEYNPLFDQQMREQEIQQAYRVYMNLQRDEERTAIHKIGIMSLRSDAGHFHLINYSKSGYNISGSNYLAKGVVISVRFETEEGIMEKELTDAGITPFDIEVKWGQADGKQYNHGVSVIGLNAQQKAILFQKIRGYLKASRDKGARIDEPSLLGKAP